MRTEDWEEMEALRGTFSPSLDVESGLSDAFMECLRNWYASSNESMGMTRPSTKFFDENGIHTPRSPQLTPSSFLLGNQRGENQARESGQEIGESSLPSEYDLKSEVLDIRGTLKGSWDSTYVELLESFENEIFLPESPASIAENVSTWNEVDGQLTTGSGGQFEDTSEQSELDELDIMVNLLCPRCDNLLYRPIVLNCGHVLCERCIAVPRGAMVKCPSCKRHQKERCSAISDSSTGEKLSSTTLRLGSRNGTRRSLASLEERCKPNLYFRIPHQCIYGWGLPNRLCKEFVGVKKNQICGLNLKHIYHMLIHSSCLSIH